MTTKRHLLKNKLFLQDLANGPIAIWPDWLNAFIAEESLRASERMLGRDAVVHPSRERAVARKSGGVAVIPVKGLILPKYSIWEAYGYATSLETIVSLVRQSVQDDEIKAVVLDVDSPGGSATGLPEAAEQLRALRGNKPIVAHADYLAASAAYYIAAQADEIDASPSALTGSVGVYSMHADFSQMLENEGIKVTFIHAGEDKVLGNAYEPLSDNAKAYIQGLVDDAYRMFVEDVAAGRGVSVADVRDNYGNGRILTSGDAKKAGVIDKVRTLDETLAAYGITNQRSRSAMARRSREVELCNTSRLLGSTKE